MKRLFDIFIVGTVLGVLSWAGDGSGMAVRAAEILAGIKGSDDRLTMVSGEYPWSAVGRINTETGGHCTGVLVGPNVVMTAAHCLYDKRKQWFVPPSQVHFVAGYFREDDEYTGGEVKYKDTEFVGHSVARSYFIPPNYKEGVAPTGKIAASDWAFIMLKDSIGFNSGWFGVRSMDRQMLKQFLETETPFVQAGYSKDKKRELTAHINCPFEGFASGLALAVHRCDAVPGDSGSPIIYFENGLPMLVAIHVATTQQRSPVRGVAVPTKTFIAGIEELKLGEPGLPLDNYLLPVETTRKLLAHLGYTGGGSSMERAIRRFQDSEGLEITGKITYKLIGQLVTVMARDSDR